MATLAKPATLDDFLRAETEAPEGTRLALIDGEIVVWGANLTTRNSRHSTAMTRFSQHLNNWLDQHPEIEGVITGGEARCRLSRDPERLVGLDVAYFRGPEHVSAACFSSLFEGPPEIAVEILSGSDTHDDVVDRMCVFFEAGVKQVWIVDVDLRRVTVYRPDGEAQIFTAKHELTAEPELPGFRVIVDSLFAKIPS